MFWSSFPYSNHLPLNGNLMESILLPLGQTFEWMCLFGSIQMDGSFKYVIQLIMTTKSGFWLVGVVKVPKILLFKISK